MMKSNLAAIVILTVLKAATATTVKTDIATTAWGFVFTNVNAAVDSATKVSNEIQKNINAAESQVGVQKVNSVENRK